MLEIGFVQILTYFICDNAVGSQLFTLIGKGKNIHPMTISSYKLLVHARLNPISINLHISTCCKRKLRKQITLLS